MNAPKVEEPPTESARLDTLQAEKQRLLTKEESQKQDDGATVDGNCLLLWRPSGGPPRGAP